MTEINQIAENDPVYQYYKIKGDGQNDQEQTVALFDHANPNNSQYDGKDLAYKLGTDGQYRKLSGQDAQDYAKQVFNWGHSLPNNPQLDKSEAGFTKVSTKDGTQVAFGNSSVNQGFAWTRQKTGDGRTTEWKQEKMDNAPEWLKAAKNQVGKEEAKTTANEAEKKKEEIAEKSKPNDAYKPIKTETLSERVEERKIGPVSFKHTVREEKTHDSPQDIKDNLKAGGTDIDNKDTQRELAINLVNNLSTADKMRVLMAQGKGDEAAKQELSKIMQEPIAEGRKSPKAMEVLGKIYLDDPIKGAATALMLAENVSDRGKKRDLNELATAFYQSATEDIKPISMRDYEIAKRVGQRYYNEIQKIPEKQLSADAREYLGLYDQFLKTEASYGAKSVSFDRLDEAMSFHRMQKIKKH